jgi:hypothetical protein
MNYKLWLFCAALFLPALLPAQQADKNQSFTVYGNVIDSLTQEPISGAAVFLTENRIGIYTDKKGFYGLATPPGTYTLRASFLGYSPKVITLTVDKNLIVDILLSKDAKFLEEVTVISSKPEENVRSTETGVAQLSIRSIRKIPAFMGEIDVVRSLQMLPGVSTVGEGASGLNVRGGSIDQNLVLMDDAPVFNSSHLFGFFSIFNPDAVRDVTLSRGGVSAEYGGRTSAVLDVKLKEPDLEKKSFYGGVGLISNRLGMELPLIKNKLAVLLTGRGSFNDFLFKLGPEEIQGTVANFYDFTGKILFKPSEKTRLSYTSYYSYDAFKLPSDSLNTVNVNASSSLFKYRTYNQTLRFSWFVGDKASFTLSGVQSVYKANTTVPDSSIAFDLNSGIRLRMLKARYVHTGEKNNLSFGLESNHYQIDPNQLVPGPFSNVLPMSIQPELARESALYLENEWKLNPKLSLLTGLRYSFFQRLGADTVLRYGNSPVRNEETLVETQVFESGATVKSYGGFEPRLSLRYSLNESSSIKASFNRMRQYLQLISNTTAALPTARWGSSDVNILPQIADQVALGFFKNMQNNRWETSAEVYYRRNQNFPDYRDLADLIFSKNLEQEVIQGQGRAYGLELMARKNAGFLTGWVTYTYARTQLKVGPEFADIHNYTGAWYPANYDKPHTLNIMTNYRTGINVTFSANFTYSTGRPATYPLGRFIANGNAVPIYPNRNLQRIPDYHRLDLALIVEPNPNRPRKWQGTWVLSVYNLYSRDNAYSVYFELNRVEQTNAYKLAVFGAAFPSLTYNFKF